MPLRFQNLLMGILIRKGQPLPEEAIIPHELAAVLQTAIPHIHVLRREPLTVFHRSQYRKHTAGHFTAMNPLKAQIAAGAILGSGQHDRSGAGMGRPRIVFPIRSISITPEAAALPVEICQVFSGQQDPVDLLSQIPGEPKLRTLGRHRQVGGQGDGLSMFQQIAAGLDDHLRMARRGRIPEAGPECRGIVPQTVGKWVIVRQIKYRFHGSLLQISRTASRSRAE